MAHDIDQLRTARERIVQLLGANAEFVECAGGQEMTFSDRLAITQTIAILSSTLLLCDYIEYFAAPEETPE